MVQELTKGTVYAGEYIGPYGQVEHAIVAQVARTDTSFKVIGALPAGATITKVEYVQPASGASDAQTTAVLDVGYVGGTGKELISDADVKGGSDGYNALNTVGVVSTAKVVEAKYHETGTASAAGGPWTVVVRFVTNIKS